MTYEEYVELRNSGRDLKAEFDAEALEKIGVEPEWKSGLDWRSQEYKDQTERRQDWYSAWRELYSKSLHYAVSVFKRENTDITGQLIQNGDFVIYCAATRTDTLRVAKVLDVKKCSVAPLAPASQGSKGRALQNGLHRCIKITPEYAEELIKAINE